MALAVALAASGAFAPRHAVAQQPPTPHEAVVSADAPPCENDVWLISIRGWRHCCQDVHIKYWRLRCNCWVPAGLEEYLASDVPGRPTCFWVHGWRIAADAAKTQGLDVYRRMACQSCRPFRLVIWSWPSEPTKTFLEDARQKACLSDVGAYPLAWLIDRTDPRVPVSLVGFSLGARMSTGALHLLGGGQLAGWHLHERVHPERTPCRAVLLAGALDNFSLAVGQRNGMALSQVDRMLLMVNCGDIVLKRYPMLCPGWNGPEAIGYTGPVGHLPHHEGLRTMYVNHIVGRKHDQDPYFDSCCILAAIVDTALFCDVVEATERAPKPVAKNRAMVRPSAARALQERPTR
jgi:hypothetical protein